MCKTSSFCRYLKLRIYPINYLIENNSVGNPEELLKYTDDEVVWAISCTAFPQTKAFEQ